jgi:signal transduction histidine kinase/CheY-like chemotaxis protein
MTGASAPPASSDTGLAEEVRSAFDYMPAQLAGNLAGIGVILMLFWRITPTVVIVPWLAALSLLWLARLWLLQRFQRADPQSIQDWARWRLLWNLGTLISAALWGATTWLLYLRGGHSEQLGLIITVYTFCVAVVPILATQPRMFLAFSGLCFVPMATRVASDGTDNALELAAILLLIFGLTTVLARNYRQALQRALELKLQSDHLAFQLRVEKTAADAARREAEIANRAKTQFFTAASHDLRQPLHAMGLFAEALRQKNQDIEVAHLVDSINESVDALEGLFSQLLDITRIDSGGIEVEPRHFTVGELFRKLCLHFEPIAFEQGLSLRFRGDARVVHADPLLVERIARNLVSNAIRYTTDGSVLVSCRRRGDRLVLQVWDTGSGIEAREQSRVFEEFYQVPGVERSLQHERRGLGLGLAIVKRLADLMHAPISLRSTLGHGTVFSLELPIGRLAPTLQPLPSSTIVPGPTLDGREVLIVEDEPAVLMGLQALLEGWGARVVAFDSLRAVAAWASAVDVSAMASSETAIDRPDLLIVDYRLESGATGIDALDVLRQRFGAQLPAIMITGSMISARDVMAQQKDFHLLTKPVAPNKLRAMIAFKLAARLV